MRKKIKMYAVVAIASDKAYIKAGDIYGSGWGTMQSWVFKKKWEAEDALEQENLSENFKIIPCEISYELPKKKSK